MRIDVKWLLASLLALLLAALPLAGVSEQALWEAGGAAEVEALPAEEAVPEAGESELPARAATPAPSAEEAGMHQAPDPSDGENEAPETVPPTLAQETLKLGVKEKATLSLTDGASAKSVGAVFSSSRPKIASVNRTTGAIRARKAGKTTITMTAQGVRSKCVVTVLKAPSKVTLSAKKLTLGVGEQRGLTAKLPRKTASAIAFSTSNARVATVDAQGNITAHRKGTAVITARTFNKKKASCKVTVKAAPKSVALSPVAQPFWVGDTRTLKPELSKKSAGAYTYAVSDEAVVSVSGDKLTALSPGVATVSVTTYNGKSAEVQVSVSRKPVYRALLVGEADFPGTGMKSLPAKKDVALMKKMLASVKGPAGTGWSVVTRSNRTAAQIRSDIQTAYAGAQEGDVSLFYISTHGDEELTIDSEQPEYVGCLQTYPDRRYDSWHDRNTLTLTALAQWLQEVPGQVIVLIDSCGSGAAIYTAKGVSAPIFSPESFGEAVVDAFQALDRGVMAPGMEDGEGAFVVRNKFYVLTSCDYLETGWSEEDRYSYFTKWLTDGIGTKGRMAADANKNKRTTLSELYKYIRKRAGKKVFVYKGVEYRQHVQIYPSGSSFELFYRK